MGLNHHATHTRSITMMMTVTAPRLVVDDAVSHRTLHAPVESAS